MTKKAIKEANAWVKHESELLYNKDLSSGTNSLSRGRGKGTLPAPAFPSFGGFGSAKRAREEAIRKAEEAARAEAERIQAAAALAKERVQRVKGLVSTGVKSAVSAGVGYGLCWWLQVRSKRDP